MFAYVFFVSILLFARDVYLIKINKFVFLAVFIVTSFFLKKEGLIYLLCFTLPLLNGLPGNYLLLVWIAFYIINYRKINTMLFAAFLLFSVFEFASFIDFGFSFNRFIELIAYLSSLFLLFFIIYDSKICNKKECLFFYIFGVFVFCLIVVISTLKSASSNWLLLFSNGDFRFGRTIIDSSSMHIGANENELAFYSIVGFSIGLFLINLSSLKFLFKMALIPITVVIGFIGALSVSRSYVFVMIIVLVSYSLMQFRNIKRVFSLLITLILFFVFLLFVYIQNPSIFEAFISRFSYSNFYTAGERVSIWNDYWSFFFNSPFHMVFGTGVVEYINVTGFFYSMHNMFQQIVVCYGIPLSIVFFYILLKPVLIRIRSTRFDERWLPLIGVLFFTQTIQFLNPYSLMLHYIVAIFALDVPNKASEGFRNG